MLMIMMYLQQCVMGDKWSMNVYDFLTSKRVKCEYEPGKIEPLGDRNIT